MESFNSILKKENDIDLEIRNIIEKNDRITTNEVANSIGVSRSTIIRNLKYIDDIKYIGSSKIGYWKIIKNRIDF